MYLLAIHLITYNFFTLTRLSFLVLGLGNNIWSLLQLCFRTYFQPLILTLWVMEQYQSDACISLIVAFFLCYSFFRSNFLHARGLCYWIITRRQSWLIFGIILSDYSLLVSHAESESLCRTIKCLIWEVFKMWATLSQGISLFLPLFHAVET